MTSVIVWDCKENPPDVTENVLCWRSYDRGEGISSIPRHLEDHAIRLRAKYLAFIHDLGESRVNGKRVVDHLDLGDGFSFWWMSLLAEKSPLKSPRIYDCLRLLALEEILLEIKPSSLIFHGIDQDLAHALQRLCQNLQISFVWQLEEKPGQKWSLRRLYLGLPYPMQGLVSFARQLVLRWPLRKLQKPQWFSSENAIFICSYFIHLDPASCAEGRFYSRQWGSLTKHLHDNGRQTNWIQHFLFSPIVPDIRTGLGWLRLFNRDASNQGYHSFLDTYLTWNIVGRVLKCWLSLQAANWRLRHIQSAFYPKGSAVWLWPILRNDWLTSTSGQVAIMNCQWVALFDDALNDMPHQEMGLYLCENQGWERALLHAWRKHGHGKIIGVVHATVPFWLLYYFDDPRSLYSGQDATMPLPDCLAVNGPVAWCNLVEAGYPVERLVEVEALRYLNLSGIVAKPVLDSAEYNIAKQTAPVSREVNVLILGDMIPVSMHNFLRLLEDTMKLLPAGYKFTFKPHPGYAVHLAEYPGLQADTTSEALDQILGGYDIALAANSTSASVDAYVAGLPVIIGLDGDGLNLSPLRGQTSVYFTSTPEELAQAFQLASQILTTNPDTDRFFFLDSELPRWSKLLFIENHIIA